MITLKHARDLTEEWRAKEPVAAKVLSGTAVPELKQVLLEPKTYSVMNDGLLMTFDWDRSKMATVLPWAVENKLRVNIEQWNLLMVQDCFSCARRFKDL